MKKSVKIKSLIVFMAWGIVFLHGTIPHNHINEQSGCHSLVHESAAERNEAGDLNHVKGIHTENEKVCHFQTTLFQQQGFEEFLPANSQISQIIPDTEANKITDNHQGSFHLLADTGPTLLRAPPTV